MTKSLTPTVESKGDSIGRTRSYSRSEQSTINKTKDEESPKKPPLKKKQVRKKADGKQKRRKRKTKKSGGGKKPAPKVATELEGMATPDGAGVAGALSMDDRDVPKARSSRSSRENRKESTSVEASLERRQNRSKSVHRRDTESRNQSRNRVVDKRRRSSENNKKTIVEEAQHVVDLYIGERCAGGVLVLDAI